jgi:hypothetical protein
MKIPFIPQLFPGEHMLSGVARALLLAGKKNLEDAQHHFFGKSVPLSPWLLIHSAMQVYMPESLSIKERQHLLVNHSLIGFFSHSLRHQKVVAALENNIDDRNWPRIPHVEELMFANIWRYCPICVHDDELQYGTSFWRVSHQLHTSITCDRHPECKLIDRCWTCGAVTKDLKGHPIPNCKCPQCEAIIKPEMFEHNEVTYWVQNAGLQLLNSADDLKSPVHSHAMRYGFANVTSSHRLFGWEKFAAAQDDFHHWLLRNKADVYFAPNTIEKRHKALDFHKMTIYQRKVPPVSLLLGFKFLGVESIDEIE